MTTTETTLLSILMMTKHTQTFLFFFNFLIIFILICYNFIFDFYFTFGDTSAFNKFFFWISLFLYCFFIYTLEQHSCSLTFLYYKIYFPSTWKGVLGMTLNCIWWWVLQFWRSEENGIALLSYLPTPPLGQDMTQGQFLSGV